MYVTINIVKTRLVLNKNKGTLLLEEFSFLTILIYSLKVYIYIFKYMVAFFYIVDLTELFIRNAFVIIITTIVLLLLLY